MGTREYVILAGIVSVIVATVAVSNVLTKDIETHPYEVGATYLALDFFDKPCEITVVGLQQHYAKIESGPDCRIAPGWRKKYYLRIVTKLSGGDQALEQ